MPVSTEFQKRIREFAAESNLNYSDLVKAIGINEHPFSHAIQYGIIPSTRILIRIADYFQVSISYLLGKTDDETFYPSETNADFFTRITDLCAERDITFYEAAKQCHLDKSYISRWVRTKSLPTLELLELVVDFFDVSIDYLLGRTDERD
ncbi:MAG: helix-turn-helix transcriptional regulator [Clostridia bacterium]|nr:helix-turn-helix transcriptional regulator [Clostridia bacterium]